MKILTTSRVNYKLYYDHRIKNKSITISFKIKCVFYINSKVKLLTNTTIDKTTLRINAAPANEPWASGFPKYYKTHMKRHFRNTPFLSSVKCLCDI